MVDNTAALLDVTLRTNGIPIVGVSIGSAANRATWVIQYDPSATAQNRTDGEALRLSFDPAAPSVTAAALDRDAVGAMQQNVIKAVLAEMLETKLGRVLTAADIPTLQPMFQRTITYYKFIVNNGL